MAKKTSGVKIFFIIFGILVVACGVLVGLYFSNLLPSFNESVNQVLKLNQVSQEDIQRSQREELLKQQTSIKGLYPHLLPTNEENVNLVKEVRQSLPPSILSFKDDYSISYFGIQKETAVLGGYESSPTIHQKDVVNTSSHDALWSYIGSFPPIAPPADFSDCIVFIDAQPALVCLDKTSGAEIFRIPCEVYPGTESFSRNTSYYFKSKTDNWYEVKFEKGFTLPETLSPAREVIVQNNIEQELYDSLLPEQTALDFIDAKMNGLLSVTPPVSVAESILYYPQEPVAFIPNTISPTFVFAPQEQGTYTLGLCDQDGTWVRDKAFVVLYTMAGEALAISLDYVADRPQITTHLSDQELYMACAGFFPDSLILDPSASQDFRETSEANPLEKHFSGETVIVDTENGPMEMDVIVLGERTSDRVSTDQTLSVEFSESEKKSVPIGSRRQSYFQVKRVP